MVAIRCVAYEGGAFPLKIGATSSNWERVCVIKKDEKGEWIKNQTTGKIEELFFIKDKATGDLYWDESRFWVGFKCAALTLINPFYTAGMMAWHLARIPVDIVKIGMCFMQEKEKSCCLMRKHLWEIPKSVVRNLWLVIRDPIYGLGVELAALGGVVSPYEMRKLIARVEKGWHHGVSFKEDFRMHDSKVGSCWSRCVYGVKHAQTFYEAWCFQIRHNINDPDLKVLPSPPGQ